MKKILERKLNQAIKEKEFIFNFQIEKQGIYAIEITGSAKSWFQNLVNLRSFFKDDDLTLRIDNIEFPKRGLKQRRLFDGEVAWNGNNLKGLKKTDLFLINLEKGKHALEFLADQSPKIHSIRIYQLEKNEKEINYLPEDNYSIEDGNRRQWLTIILVNLGLKTFKITASVKEGKKFLFFKKDDSDLKLIINGEIQENQESKSHKNWFWCGRTLKGKEKTFEKELNLSSGLHYIEFWADRSPEVKETRIGISQKESYPIFQLKDIKKYTYKGINGNEDYNRFDKEILETVNFWNKFFLSQEYPPKEPLDPNLVKAMIYVESRMGYYTSEEGHYPAYADVMQVADPRNPAIHTLNNDGWVDPTTGEIAREYEWTEKGIKVLDYHKKANGATPKESIFWGERWLYHKAQTITENRKREWKLWITAVKNYHHKDDITYQKKVFEIYQKGISPKGIKLWNISFLALFLLTGILGIYILSNQGRIDLVFKNLNSQGDYQIIAKILDGVWYKKINLATVYKNGANFLGLDKSLPIKITWQDLTGDKKDEVIISGHYFDNKIRIYILSKINDKWKIILKRDEYEGIEPAFYGDGVFFVSRGVNRPIEIVEENLIPYSNAPLEIWRSYYQYDENFQEFGFDRMTKNKE